MNSLTINAICETHIPHVPAISTVCNMSYDEQFTLCVKCENNIERWADASNPYSSWSNWKVSN
jgi:hypothetical protein